MANVGVNISTFLVQMGITNPEAYSEVAEEISRIRNVSAGRVEAWAGGEELADPGHLRGLAAAFPHHRDKMVELIDSTALLTALWCQPLAEKLAERRTHLGVSLYGFAHSVGVSHATVRRWEKASTVPRIDKLREVLAALGLDARQLLDFGDWPPSVLPIGEPTSFALWIARAKQALETSEGDLAKKLGFSQPTVNAWARARAFPVESSWETLVEKVNALGLPLTVEYLAAMQPVREVELKQAVPTTALSALIQTSRNAANIDLASAAKTLGVGLGAFRSWEAGDIVPRAVHFPVLREAFKISQQTLVDALTANVGDAVNKFGRNGVLLTAWRQSAGYDRPTLGRVIGRHRNQLYRWECGLAPLSTADVRLLSRTLNIPVGTLQADTVELATTKAQRAQMGSILRQERLRRGLSQRQVGLLCGGYTQTAISSFENGTAELPEAVRVFLTKVTN